MNQVTVFAGLVCIIAGCASPDAMMKRQAQSIGEKAEVAVASAFPDVPRDEIHWANVFWSCMRSTPTNPPVGSVSVELYDIRTFREDSYCYPRVKRFEVEMDLNHNITDVLRATDGILRRPGEQTEEQGTSNQEIQPTK